jgi:ElaB/YqjD/DUF883 family membrane-anchored ribosome-binding protein
MQKNGSASALESRLEQLKESVRHLVDAGGERAGHLKERAMGVKDSVLESGGAALDRIGTFVKEHPFVAISAAFGLGYFAIRLLRK